jgi:predicted acyltransferase
MVFPFFLRIMGMAMTFSFVKRQTAGATGRSLLLHALKRSAIIFALGLLINAFPFGIGVPFSFATVRIPGVLQRIAICYLVAAVLLIATGIRVQILTSLFFLATYWFLIKLVPVPGYGAGVLEPLGNLGWYIDSTLLHGHAFAWAPAKGFDPEGILSTIPAFATTLFGVFTGYWLRTERSREKKTVWMLLAGFIMIVAGTVLDRWLPINKNLWTSSFAVFMGGWALVCFSAFYWLLDVRRTARPLEKFSIFGMNAITLYVVSELLAMTLFVIRVMPAGGVPTTLHDRVYSSLFASWLSPLNASLAYAIAFVGVMYLLGWMMWKRNWFVKV